MKKLLLVLCLVFAGVKTRAQVVFCPPGAEWHYLFTKYFYGNTGNEEVRYLWDSIDGPDTFKVLTHRRSSMSCGSPSVRRTWIRQVGDTIFFKNAGTQGTWQILYNFAALPGQSWSITMPGLSSVKVFNFTVTAVNTVTVNGFSLKELSLASSTCCVSKITERLGPDTYFFPFSFVNLAACHDDAFLESLCYQDSTFGLKQFGEKSCDYFTSNFAGISEKEENGFQIQYYPNPVKDLLNLETNIPGEAELSFSDISGREVKRSRIGQTNSIDVKDLRAGIYFLSVIKDNNAVYTSKLIRE